MLRRPHPHRGTGERDRDRQHGTHSVRRGERRPRRIAMTGMKGRVICSLATATLLVVGLLPADAQTQGPPRGRGSKGGWGAGLMLGVPLHTLNLTPDQQTQVKSILSTYREAARPIVQQLWQIQSGLGDRLLGPGQV